MKKFILLISCFLITHTAFSQDSDFGNWLLVFNNKKINTKWNWHSEIQHRNYNAIGDLEQLLLRTGIGYNLTENNNNFLLGYGYILSENYLGNSDEKTSVNEHRIFQQFITRQKFSRVSLQHRYRFEQRFIEDNFKLRFRYFLAMTVALNNNSLTDRTFYLSAYNEIFLNTENVIFDRNRLYGGLGYKFSPKIRMELGYMNQFFTSACRDQLNIVTFLSF